MDPNEEEGFFTDKPVLESVIVRCEDSKTARPVDFEPRYVCSLGLLRYLVYNPGGNHKEPLTPLVTVRFSTALLKRTVNNNIGK